MMVSQNLSVKTPAKKTPAKKVAVKKKAIASKTIKPVTDIAEDVKETPKKASRRSKKIVYEKIIYDDNAPEFQIVIPVVVARKVRSTWHLLQGDVRKTLQTRSDVFMENEEKIASASSQVQAVSKAKDKSSSLKVMTALPEVIGYHIEITCPSCGVIGRNTNESYALQRCFEHWQREHPNG